MDLLNNSNPLVNILSKIYEALKSNRTQTIYERHFDTGDGSKVAFVLSNIPKSYIIVMLDNQESNIDFTITGNTITFETAPASSIKVSAIYDVGG